MSESPMEADVVVVGSGVSGLAAALEAAQGGARVTVFEKQPSIGGTSNFFEGMFAVGSAMQKEKYIAYSPDQAFKNFMEYNHWRVDARLVRSLINRSADTIDWLEARGVEFLEVTINMPDAPRTYHVVKGRGQAVVKALVLKAKEKGIAVRAAAPVKQILKGKRGPSGVVVELDGKDTEVACRAVVIASGGSKTAGPAAASASPTPEPKVQVVVAAKDIAAGTQMSCGESRSTPENPGGVTPIITAGTSLTSIRLPTSRGSLLKRVCQHDQLTTATAAPTDPRRSSSWEISRPAAG